MRLKNDEGQLWRHCGRSNCESCNEWEADVASRGALYVTEARMVVKAGVGHPYEQYGHPREGWVLYAESEWSQRNDEEVLFEEVGTRSMKGRRAFYVATPMPASTRRALVANPHRVNEVLRNNVLLSCMELLVSAPMARDLYRELGDFWHAWRAVYMVDTWGGWLEACAAWRRLEVAMSAQTRNFDALLDGTQPTTEDFLTLHVMEWTLKHGVMQ